VRDFYFIWDWKINLRCQGFDNGKKVSKKWI